MHIWGAKFQEHCFNISRDIVYSVFYHFQMRSVWHHHWSNLHNRKTPISLKRKKIFQKEKRHSSVFWKAFQITRNYFSCHIHLYAYHGSLERNEKVDSWGIEQLYTIQCTYLFFFSLTCRLLKSKCQSLVSFFTPVIHCSRANWWITCSRDWLISLQFVHFCLHNGPPTIPGLKIQFSHSWKMQQLFCWKLIFRVHVFLREQ